MCNVLHLRGYVSVNLCCSYGEKSVFFPSCTPYGHGKKEKQSSTHGEARATFLVSLQHHDSRRSSASDAEPKTSEALRLHVVPSLYISPCVYRPLPIRF